MPVIIHDMDKMCQKLEDLNETTETAKETERAKCGSPVFKCVLQVKSARETFLDFSDRDIASNQVNQSIKNRTSSKCGSETSDSILPFCPIFSPIPVAPASQFQSSSTHSLETFGKNLDKSAHNKVSCFPVSNKKEVFKAGGIFESLGMLDKDISWVSSMASPPPKLVPGSEFNTVEKATFLPEKNFQSIQPRALFSPTSDDDFGCHPITFTSESDDDEVYKSNIRLSDVCATLNQLEFKSLDQVINNSIEKIIAEDDCVISPVIRTKKTEIVKKKKKGTLVVSPQEKDKFELLVGESSKKIKTTDKNHTIEDDSFQSISFSCIDELCKTLVSEKSDSFRITKDSECDKTLVNGIDTSSKLGKPLKKFYSSNSAADVHAVSSMDNLHLYAKALEEGDKCIPAGGKIDQSYADKGIVRFDVFSKDLSKSDATKRLHSEVTDEKDESIEKKLKTVDDEDSSWQNVKEYLSESQLNVSDGEIFRTVENLEKSLASQESKEMEKPSGTCTQVKSQEQEGSPNSKHNVDSTETRNETFHTEDLYKDLLSMRFPAFTTASGSKIQVSEKALKKAREILKDCDENLENYIDKQSTEYPNKTDQRIDPLITEGGFAKGFSTLSGKQIKISAGALEKAKTFMLECEASESSFQPSGVDCNEVLQGKFWEALMNSSAGLGKEIQASAKTLEKTNSLVSERDENQQKQLSDVSKVPESFLTGFEKKIQTSEKALAEAKASYAEWDDQKEEPWKKGFKTGYGKLIQVSARSLEKAKALMLECDEQNFSKFAINWIEGLQATHSQNKVSSKVFEKPEMSESAEVNPTTLKDSSTGSVEIIPDSTAVEKAKAFSKNYEQEFNDNCSELASTLSKELINQKSPDVSKNEITVESCEKSQIREEDIKIPTIGFSTALGKKEQVSSKALERAKAFWSKSDESGAKMPEISATLLPPPEYLSAGLSTENESKVATPEAPTAKTKEETPELDQNQCKDFKTFDSTIERPKILEKNPDSETTNGERKPDKLSSTSWTDKSDDWEEIIPSWLHVYKTSPSMASDRLELSPVASHEDGKSFTPDRDYVIKSPVLGSGDRFYGKGKRRKLRLGEEKQLETQSGFVASDKAADRKTSAKRISNLSLDFSAPFKRIKVVDDVTAVSARVKEERARAREEQERTVREKQKVKPVEGSHLRKKRSERQMSWMEAVGRSSPEMHSEEFLSGAGVNADVLLVNIQNSVSFRFNGEHYFGSAACLKNTKGIPAGDGCLVILDDENKAGVEEIKRAFLASPGVQPNLVARGWVENHYKWIVWKLAHYERSFPLHFGGRCLTPNQVMLQLKYRYDREIDRNERSALKKILERDDSSVKRLVLCVCGIKKVAANETTGYELQLTDGWYSCPARSDPAMSRLIEEGKLSIGTKLLTQGAVLVNCEQGVSPLELSEDVYLKISTNSTRRIRWDAKLGFQKNPENFPISLGSILAQGGPISRIDVIIVRIYPMLYKEKTSEGHHVTRNRRSEEKADAEFRKVQEEKMEIISKEIQSELRRSVDLEKNLKSFNDFEEGDDFCALMEADSDLSALQDTASLDQRTLLEKLHLKEKDRFGQELAEKIEKRLEKERLKLQKRSVSQFLRVKIVDFRKPDYNNPALLSVWNPNEDLTSLLVEGKVFAVLNVTISNSSRIYKPMQINTTRSTRFRPIAKSVKYPRRTLTLLKSVSSKVCPAFEEVDLVGMVALIQDVSHGSRLSQVVYLTDLEMNFVGVVFWGNCKDFGWENVLRIQSIVACSNLQWKKNYTFQDVPSVYANENSVFTENPKQDYLKEEIERLKRNLPQDVNAFLSKCEVDLTAKLDDSKWGTNTSKNSSNDSSPKVNPLKNLQVAFGFESKPAASSTPVKSFTFKSCSEDAEPSPIQKRIEKLQSYGEPSPLIPLVIRNNLKRKFQKSSKPSSSQSVI